MTELETWGRPTPSARHVAGPYGIVLALAALVRFTGCSTASRMGGMSSASPMMSPGTWRPRNRQVDGADVMFVPLMLPHHEQAESMSTTLLTKSEVSAETVDRAEHVRTAQAFRHLWVNPWLWGALAASVLLQAAVVHLPFLNTAFGTEPLTWTQWVVATAMASTVLWVSELRKLVLRHRDRHRASRTRPPVHDPVRTLPPEERTS